MPVIFGTPGGGGGGGGSTTTIRVVEEFTATGGQVNFVLGASPAGNATDVYLNGMLMNEGATDDYTLTGNTVTFNYGLSAGDVVIVKYFTSIGTSALSRTVEEPAVSGGQTIFNLAGSPLSSDLDVYHNGLLQNEGAADDYTYATGIVTFTFPMTAGDVVIFKYFI